jgi:hypothetical protein
MEIQYEVLASYSISTVPDNIESHHGNNNLYLEILFL